MGSFTPSIDIADIPELRRVVGEARALNQAVLVRDGDEQEATQTLLAAPTVQESEMVGVLTRAQYERAMSASNRRPCAGVLLELRVLVGIVDIRHDARGTRLAGVEVRVERERGELVEADCATRRGGVRLDSGRLQGAGMAGRDGGRLDDAEVGAPAGCLRQKAGRGRPSAGQGVEDREFVDGDEGEAPVAERHPKTKGRAQILTCTIDVAREQVRDAAQVEGVGERQLVALVAECAVGRRDVDGGGVRVAAEEEAFAETKVSPGGHALVRRGSGGRKGSGERRRGLRELAEVDRDVAEVGVGERAPLDVAQLLADRPALLLELAGAGVAALLAGEQAEVVQASATFLRSPAARPSSRLRS